MFCIDIFLFFDSFLTAYRQFYDMKHFCVLTRPETFPGDWSSDSEVWRSVYFRKPVLVIGSPHQMEVETSTYQK